MVDVEEHLDYKYVILSTDKRLEKYTLEKDNSGYAHFSFRVSKGPVPEGLQGKFTSLEKGIEAFKSYERGLKESNAVRQKELQEFREQRRAKSSTESN